MYLHGIFLHIAILPVYYRLLSYWPFLFPIILTFIILFSFIWGTAKVTQTWKWVLSTNLNLAFTNLAMFITEWIFFNIYLLNEHLLLLQNVQYLQKLERLCIFSEGSNYQCFCWLQLEYQPTRIHFDLNGYQGDIPKHELHFGCIACML